MNQDSIYYAAQVVRSQERIRLIPVSGIERLPVEYYLLRNTGAYFFKVKSTTSRNSAVVLYFFESKGTWTTNDFYSYSTTQPTTPQLHSWGVLL